MLFFILPINIVIIEIFIMLNKSCSPKINFHSLSKFLYTAEFSLPLFHLGLYDNIYRWNS